MDTFAPPGVTEPEATPEMALALLRDQLQLDFTQPYQDATDLRHELAVLAVDLGRRRLDLTQRLMGAGELDALALTRLSDRIRRQDTFHADQPEALPTAVAVVMYARIAEVDRTLRMVLVAFKQAWWAGAEAGTAPS